MSIVKMKPTSPGRRHQVRVVNKDLHTGKPHKALLEPHRWWSQAALSCYRFQAS